MISEWSWFDSVYAPQRVPHVYRPGLHVFDHEGARPDDGSSSDPYPFEYGGIETQPYVVFDNDLFPL